ncbi:hypothetical protein CJ179_33420 [Rhodococcus sp. ACS1]|uniref:SRPBCC family protein n=1 Tax=Rhodococcus sp. ACS1 TaxID=2028570 RepID=UPI000BB137EE|nr:SRPBCC family protein [Rhodococcus sp. ACS1]PBC40191.1 hypothetical protein CJ179_33420 [Rhodococcus sp. ACS1]
MRPQDYSARTAYRPPAAWYRRLNWLGVLLTSIGLAPRDAVTLEVRGRTSGRIRRVPILRTRYRGAEYLVALAGESQWARNVRAARGRAVIRRRRARSVLLDELPPVERPGVIAEYLRAARNRSGAEAGDNQARFYFGLDPDASLDDIGRIVDGYPVFRVRYVDSVRGSAWSGRRRHPSARIEGEITIGRPMDVVFDYVADQTNEPLYNPSMVRAEKITAGPIGEGTQFRSAVRSAGRTAEMLIECTDYDRPRLFVSTTTMKQADIDYTLRFDPVRAGTLMRWCGHVEPKGPLRLLWPLITWMGVRQEQRIWSNLKRHLEATPDAGG